MAQVSRPLLAQIPRAAPPFRSSAAVSASFLVVYVEFGLTFRVKKRAASIWSGSFFQAFLPIIFSSSAAGTRPSALTISVSKRASADMTLIAVCVSMPPSLRQARALVIAIKAFMTASARPQSEMLSFALPSIWLFSRDLPISRTVSRTGRSKCRSCRTLSAYSGALWAILSSSGVSFPFLVRISRGTKILPIWERRAARSSVSF